MYKIAVASTDGISVNEHFGRSKEFWLYEVDEDGEYTFVERRENCPHCVHDASDNRYTTAKLLADVAVVLVAEIGPGAEKELRSHGVIALPVTGFIDKALKAYGKRGKLIKNSIKRSFISCRPSRDSSCACGCSQAQK